MLVNGFVHDDTMRVIGLSGWEERRVTHVERDDDGFWVHVPEHDPETERVERDFKGVTYIFATRAF